jgi:hypothetical protein
MTHKIIDISEPFTPYKGRYTQVTFTYTRTNKRGCRSSMLIQRRSLPHGFITQSHTHTHSSSFLMPQITLAHYRSLKTRIKIMDA